MGFFNVLASTYQFHFDRLNLLQKRIIRIVFLLPFLSSTKSTFVNNNLLNIHQIQSFKQIALFMFSYDYNALPKIFTGFFSTITLVSRVIHFLRTTHEFSPSFAKSTFKLFPIQSFGPRLYSSIPLSFIDNGSISILSFQYSLSVV